MFDGTAENRVNDWLTIMPTKSWIVHTSILLENVVRGEEYGDRPETSHGLLSGGELDVRPSYAIWITGVRGEVFV
jgi:hypothetical protein